MMSVSCMVVLERISTKCLELINCCCDCPTSGWKNGGQVFCCVIARRSSGWNDGAKWNGGLICVSSAGILYIYITMQADTYNPGQTNSWNQLDFQLVLTGISVTSWFQLTELEYVPVYSTGFNWIQLLPLPVETSWYNWYMLKTKQLIPVETN